MAKVDLSAGTLFKRAMAVGMEDEINQDVFNQWLKSRLGAAILKAKGDQKAWEHWASDQLGNIVALESSAESAAAIVKAAVDAVLNDESNTQSLQDALNVLVEKLSGIDGFSIEKLRISNHKSGSFSFVYASRAGSSREPKERDMEDCVKLLVGNGINELYARYQSKPSNKTLRADIRLNSDGNPEISFIVPGCDRAWQPADKAGHWLGVLVTTNGESLTLPTGKKPTTRNVYDNLFLASDCKVSIDAYWQQNGTWVNNSDDDSDDDSDDSDDA